MTPVGVDRRAVAFAVAATLAIRLLAWAPWGGDTAHAAAWYQGTIPTPTPPRTPVTIPTLAPTEPGPTEEPTAEATVERTRESAGYVADGQGRPVLVTERFHDELCAPAVVGAVREKTQLLPPKVAGMFTHDFRTRSSPEAQEIVLLEGPFPPRAAHGVAGKKGVQCRRRQTGNVGHGLPA